MGASEAAEGIQGQRERAGLVLPGSVRIGMQRSTRSLCFEWLLLLERLGLSDRVMVQLPGQNCLTLTPHRGHKATKDKPMTHRATCQQERLLPFHLMEKKGVKVFHENIYGPSYAPFWPVEPSAPRAPWLGLAEPSGPTEPQRSPRGTAGKSSPRRSTEPTQPGREILGPRDTGSPPPGAMKALGPGDTGSHHPGKRKVSASRAGCPGNRRPRGR